MPVHPVGGDLPAVGHVLPDLGAAVPLAPLPVCRRVAQLVLQGQTPGVTPRFAPGRDSPPARPVSGGEFEPARYSDAATAARRLSGSPSGLARPTARAPSRRSTGIRGMGAPAPFTPQMTCHGPGLLCDLSPEFYITFLHSRRVFFLRSRGFKISGCTSGKKQSHEATRAPRLASNRHARRLRRPSAEIN